MSLNQHSTNCHSLNRRVTTFWTDGWRVTLHNWSPVDVDVSMPLCAGFNQTTGKWWAEDCNAKMPFLLFLLQSLERFYLLVIARLYIKLISHRLCSGCQSQWLLHRRIPRLLSGRTKLLLHLISGQWRCHGLECSFTQMQEP